MTKNLYISDYIFAIGDYMNTTIQLEKSTVESLKEVKEYPRQTYDELIKHIVQIVKTIKKRNQYDEFLHKIQQPKMKDLWDNKEDEVWEDV